MAEDTSRSGKGLNGTFAQRNTTKGKNRGPSIFTFKHNSAGLARAGALNTDEKESTSTSSQQKKATGHNRDVAREPRGGFVGSGSKKHNEDVIKPNENNAAIGRGVRNQQRGKPLMRARDKIIADGEVGFEPTSTERGDAIGIGAKRKVSSYQRGVALDAQKREIVPYRVRGTEKIPTTEASDQDIFEMGARLKSAAKVHNSHKETAPGRSLGRGGSCQRAAPTVSKEGELIGVGARRKSATNLRGCTHQRKENDRRSHLTAYKKASNIKTRLENQHSEKTKQQYAEPKLASHATADAKTKKGATKRQISAHRYDECSKGKPMTSLVLNKLRDNEKDPGELLLRLTNPSLGFLTLLNTEELSAECITSILTVLQRVIEYKGAREITFGFLNNVRQSLFIRSELARHLVIGLLNEQGIEPVSNIITVLAKLCKTFPRASQELLPSLVVLKNTVENNSRDVGAKELLRKVTFLVNQCEHPYISDRTVVKTQKTESDDLQPPCDFREMSVNPTNEDIHCQGKAFIRENKVRGSYHDLNHYLDIQFRLLREDFIRPLRSGIHLHRQMQQSGRRERNMDIWLYHDVKIQSRVFNESGVSYRLSFNTAPLKKLDLEDSKRLTFGSLVCISKDNFDNIIFCKVTERDPKLLKKGIIDICLLNPNDTFANVRQIDRYNMAESTAFFEAYVHVLCGLQEIGEGFPFTKYVVYANNGIDFPTYIKNNEHATYDLTSLICIPKQTVNRRTLLLYSNVSVTNLTKWPSAKDMQLDYPQHKALQLALTKEIALIQGPPGTGKTFIGLKIMNVFLRNQAMLGPLAVFPILVVCYTNHALDQFLEGIHKFQKSDIVRVGGGSKSTKLEKYCLHNLRSGESRMFNLVIAECKDTLRRLKARIAHKELQLKQCRENILDEDVLQDQIKINQFHSLKKIQTNATVVKFETHHPSNMTEWLGLTEMFLPMPAQTEANAEEVQMPLQQKEPISLQNPQADVMQYLYVENPCVTAMSDKEGRDHNDDTNCRNRKKGKYSVAPRVIERDNTTSKMQTMGDKLTFGDKLQGENIVQGSYAIPRHPPKLATYTLQQAKTSNTNHLNVEDSRECVDIWPETATSKDSGEWELQKEEKLRIKKMIKMMIKKQLNQPNVMREEEVDFLDDITTLSSHDKWRLYRYWVQKFKVAQREKIRELEEAYQATANRLKVVKMARNQAIMRKAKVIGMTTTGAAKYRTILQEIQPRIIIVEEAAEVLEAHIITTISDGCQHLILIGDHKQLRPSPTDYEIAEKYNLKVSLFERLLNNNFPCVTLERQHRMRPQIADIVRNIYPNLKDNENVMVLPKVKGICGNVYFIDHKEQEDNDVDSISKSNKFEASYVVALCKYLLQQGYGEEEITILTGYMGQVRAIKSLMPKHTFGEVKVTSIDNYQGEENQIVLLSLVRSNAENRSGFLKEDNRICVALSRAKYGMFVIGNMSLLGKSSELWKEILETVSRTNSIGPYLKLYCQNHPADGEAEIKNVKDFTENAPEGGCQKPCLYRLDCGHVCTRKCHPVDQKHKTFKCKKSCEKVLCKFPGHKCVKQCYEDCGECMIPVKKIIPSCQHEQQVPCSVPPEKFDCVFEVNKPLLCGHIISAPCSVDVDELQQDCLVKCGQVLPCSHLCTGSCGRCLQGHVHKACTEQVEALTLCGHYSYHQCSTMVKCTKTCYKECVHVHRKCRYPCQTCWCQCQQPCAWRCKHFKCTRKCFEICNRRRCDFPCDKLLKCSHPCIGLCGELCPSLCKICNFEALSSICLKPHTIQSTTFIQLEECGHIFEASYIDEIMDKNVMLENTAHIPGFPKCPKCNTITNKTGRYGPIFKLVSQYVDLAKWEMMNVNDTAAANLKRKLLQYATSPFVSDNFENEVLKYSIKSYPNLEALISLQFSVNIAISLADLERCITKRLPSGNKAITLLRSHFIRLQNHVSFNRTTLTVDERRSILGETLRLKFMVAVIGDPKDVGFTTPDDICELRKLYHMNKLSMDDIDTRLQRIAFTPGLAERLLKINVDDILPVSFAKSNWRLCPEGHVYYHQSNDTEGASRHWSRCTKCTKHFHQQSFSK